MTYWTEAAIAKDLGNAFYVLSVTHDGRTRVFDRNAEGYVPEPVRHRVVWTRPMLETLVTLKRRSVSLLEISNELDVDVDNIDDKWKKRDKWMHEVSVPHVKTVLLKDIARTVCSVYGISKTDFFSIRRAVNIVAARQVFYWLASKLTSASLPKIGDFCGKDHSTVLHGIRVITQKIDVHRTNIEICLFDLGMTQALQEAA